MRERVALIRRSARAAVSTNLKRRRLKERAEILSTRADRLEQAVQKEVLDEAFADYSELIKALGGVALNYTEIESGASDIEENAVSAPLVEGASGEVEISQDAEAEMQEEDPSSSDA